MKISYVLGALALTMSTASFAAAPVMNCCKDECCKDKDCCNDKASDIDHAKHDMGHKHQ